MKKLSDFDYKLVEFDVNRNKEIEKLRKQFVNQYPVSFIKVMKYKDYILGQKNHDNFCYQIETGLRKLGSIQGATSKKFGMYQDRNTGEIILAKKWNVSNSPELTFEEVRKAILKLLKDGKTNNRHGIINSKISQMLCYKILSVYFPNLYLSIFSENHLNFFIAQFHENINAGDQFSEIYDKQMELIRLKNEHLIAKNWNGIEFMTYLYLVFPQAHDVREKSDIKVVTNLVDSEKSSEEDLVINGEIKSIKDIGNSKKRNVPNENSEENVPSIKGKTKIDFEERQKRLSEIGALGEAVVVNYEKDRLTNFPELARKVKQVSLNDDSLGYDVRSYNEDGTERFIEVKSTTLQKSEKLEFYLSVNELQKAKELSNYWIYRVFDVEDFCEIVMIENPFSPKKLEKIDIKPTNYFVQIKTN